jgi:hypothetical protein
VLDALHDAPAFRIEASAHLIAALALQYPRRSVFLAVVDPGVGGRRGAIVVHADGRSFVGPDNGLLSILWQRARQRACHRIAWRPAALSSSFHGRDLFAPVAAALATRVRRGWLVAKRAPEVLLPAADLAQVVYVDHYGNVITGLRAVRFSKERKLRIGKRILRYARTFEDAREPFWYENSLGLVEISSPGRSAASELRLRIGSRISG